MSRSEKRERGEGERSLWEGKDSFGEGGTSAESHVAGKPGWG